MQLGSCAFAALLSSIGLLGRFLGLLKSTTRSGCKKSCLGKWQPKSTDVHGHDVMVLTAGVLVGHSSRKTNSLTPAWPTQSRNASISVEHASFPFFARQFSSPTDSTPHFTWEEAGWELPLCDSTDLLSWDIPKLHRKSPEPVTVSQPQSWLPAIDTLGVTTMLTTEPPAVCCPGSGFVLDNYVAFAWIWVWKICLSVWGSYFFHGENPPCLSLLPAPRWVDSLPACFLAFFSKVGHFFFF